MNLVECRGVRLGYSRNLLAPCPDWQIGEGDFVVVAGPNGTGKTTLVRAVAGLLEPVEGSIVRSEKLCRGAIGYLPQQKTVQHDFPASVQEVVRSGCRASPWLPFSSGETRRRALRAMKLFGVEDLRRRSFRELSGGQRQRVLLARAVAGPRKLLLLDEPATGLDSDAAHEMYSLFARLNSQGVAILMVTHDLAPALDIATHVLTLGAGGAFKHAR